MDNIKMLVSKLRRKDVEGGIFHRNKKELDITSPAGIYKFKHKDAEIWKYVNDLLEMIDLPRDTRELKDNHLEALNNFIKQDEDINYKIFELEIQFYKEYIKRLRLHLFDNSLTWLLFNLYTNSRYGTWRSIQFAIRKLIKDKVIDYPYEKTSRLDGKFGKKTYSALVYIKELNNDNVNEKFKEAILDGMENFYLNLAKKPGFKQYKNGWLNRVKKLRML